MTSLTDASISDAALMTKRARIIFHLLSAGVVNLTEEVLLREQAKAASEGWVSITK
jgi:hypothetical protein